MDSLSEKQARVIRIIAAFNAAQGFPPTLEELADELGVTKPTAQGYVNRLLRRGALHRRGRGHRNVQVTPEYLPPEAQPGVPVCGRIAAGAPLVAVEEAERVDAATLAGYRPGCFLLEVCGDSMIEAGIHDGDFVVIDPARPPRAGDVVAALTADGEATLKQYFREGGRLRLQPWNRRLTARYAAPGEIAVQGVMTGLLRRAAPLADYRRAPVEPPAAPVGE